MPVSTIDDGATAGTPASRGPMTADPDSATGPPPVPVNETERLRNVPEGTPSSTSEANPITTILRDFGIEYPDAPRPTPAFLAFMRGLGLQLSTAEDNRRLGIGQIEARSSDQLADLNRTASRNKENITADLIRRGVLRSGESNSRYLRHGEDVANRQADIARERTSAIQNVEQAYQGVRGQLGQQGLEKTLSLETDIATREATQRAQEEAWRRQQEADTLNWQRQREAQELSYRRQMELLQQQYGGNA